MTLHLCSNVCLFLFPGMFYSSNSLDVFTVSYNKLLELEERAFYGLHLIELNLQNNQLLSHFRPLVFEGSAVERMSLDRCNITTIRSLIRLLFVDLRIIYILI